MIYAFSDCSIDVAGRELRRGASLEAVEPQVFDLLCFLIQNRDRVVSRDELIERIWGGRIVSEAAVSSRIKSARQAIGDSGEGQRLIRTFHGVGYRFVGDVSISAAARPVTHDPAATHPPAATGARPSIAVLPFQLIGLAGPYAAIADALPHDLIVEISRLRWLTVIARGSAFQFRSSEATPEAVRAALGVRYCLTGMVEVAGDRVTVTVELCDAEAGAVVWCEVYREPIGAVHEIRARIAAAAVAALDLQITAAEGRRALAAPATLDAWAAFHLGLTQMYRFDRSGAERAKGLFEDAIARDPNFARAYAGLSFAHFEGAFLGFAADRASAADEARRAAEASLELDPLDPFCNLVMGRAAWLTRDLEAALPWLDRAVELNPNYAQAKYSSAWTRTLLGDASGGQSLVDAAMALSPLDPLLYGMLGVRAFSHMVNDEPSEAALWAERAARAPRAHPLIELIAAVGHALNGADRQAVSWAASAMRRQPGLKPSDFFEAFPFRDAATHARVEGALTRLMR